MEYHHNQPKIVAPFQVKLKNPITGHYQFLQVDAKDEQQAIEITKRLNTNWDVLYANRDLDLKPFLLIFRRRGNYNSDYERDRETVTTKVFAINAIDAELMAKEFSYAKDHTYYLEINVL